MHVLILTNYFPPEVGAASYLFHDLAETLADDGHAVTVVTGFPRYRMGDERQRGLFRRERLGRSTVLRVASSPFDRGGPLRRGLDHLYLAPSLVLGGLLARRPDVILVYSPPLTLGAAGWALARRYRVPLVVNVQDLFPQYAIDIGLMTNRHMIRAFEALERFIYRTADAITVNSSGSRQHVLARGGRPDRVRVVSNWVDVDFIQPGPRDNSFRERCNLGDRFVVQYAGTMGYQQDLDTVLEAAALLRDRSDICFQLIGDGVERERLEARARELALPNVLFTPFQERSAFPLVVQSADVCVVTLRKEVHTPAIPSKLLTIMAAGKPVLFSADASGDGPATVREAGYPLGVGLCVPPGDPEQFARAVLHLADQPRLGEEMGARGRRHAEAHFSRRACVSEYENLFGRLIAEQRSRAEVGALSGER